MATNDELRALAAGLHAANELAASEARVVVISFHSHEDRMVKHQFRAWATDGRAEILTRSPHRADSAEISANRRSRSAKLRAVRMTVTT
jgi:16S rRNA (cytosine1402-N4)-methyltransferase